MANQFLIEIHNYVSQRLEAGKKDREDARTKGEADRAVYHKGKIDELEAIRAYLTEHFDLTTQKYY